MKGVATFVSRSVRVRWLVPVTVAIATGWPAAVCAQARDTAQVLDAVQHAQRRFETVRRMHLPLMPTRAQGDCDAVIGPYCYWYDPHEAPARPTESPRVTDARREFLAVLDSTGARWPTSNTIAGQRVRYRIDAGDTTGALRAAAECHADAWWCSALAGSARHVAGDFAGAAAAFDDALARMVPSRRCAWADVSTILPSRARRSFAALGCDAREREARRIWWLATPLFASGANDFRTEYLARRVAGVLEASDPVMFGQRWNGYAEEMLLRFGRQEWWTRERPSMGSTASPRIVGHELVPSFSFMPSERLLRDPTLLPRPDDWEPLVPLPSSRYAPAYARTWRDLDAQVARFRRGDSLLVVAAFDVGADSLLVGPTATLAVSPAPTGPTFRSASAAGMRAGTLRLHVPAGAIDRVALASLELVDTATRAVARHRTGVQRLPVQRIAVSDLLLHRPLATNAGAVATLQDAASHALPGPTIRDGAVGVYWETYDGAGAARTVTLTLARTDRSVLARAAARMGLVDAPHPVRIRWRDMPVANGAAIGRSITLNLRDLPDGDYVLRLEVERDDGGSAATTRAVVIDR